MRLTLLANLQLNWNGGWPTGDAEITFDRDETYLSALGDKAMMASVSTGFFTHYSKSSWNKNWIFVGSVLPRSAASPSNHPS